MIRQNIKLFLRSILRQRTHFLLTISGLIIGLTAVFLAFVVIHDEFRFDAFHSKADRIFRVGKTVKEQNGELTKNAESPGKMAPTLDADFPEVEVATRVAPWFAEVLLTYEDQNTFVKNWVYTDSNFFEIFDFSVIRGEDPAKLLSTPGNIFITPELAQTLFGAKDPVGKVVKGQNDKNFKVAGIVAAPPRQSHLQFDALVSWASTESDSGVFDFSFMNNWLGQTVYTYLLLRKPEQRIAIKEKLPAFTAKYMENRKDAYGFFLQPLKQIYLNSSELLYLRGGKYGSASFLRTFLIIAALILLIACFNYINITTARSLQRAREVGVRKVLGAERGQLVGQFLVETIGLTLIAGVFAFALAHVLLPWLNQWFDKDIPREAMTSIISIGFLLTVIVGTSLIAGFFPSLLLTKFKPITVLRNKIHLSPGGEWPRQAFTVMQLTVSVGLIAGTILFYQQFNYILNKDLGFDQEQVLVMTTPPGAKENVEAFKNELASLPGIEAVSICNAAVGDGTFGSSVIPEGSNEELMVQMFRVDSSYLKTFGMKLSAGRFLSLASDYDPGNVVVNEAFVRQVGWEKPLEKSIRFMGSDQRYPVVGVLKDFHFNSLHQEVTPMVMYLDNRLSNTSIRLEASQIAALLPQIKSIWERFENRFPFDYYFLDEYFARQYLAEQRMLWIITLFSALAIFIACLGLYGMASYAIARRRKEIGIRKILGASVMRITGLLSLRFVKLCFFALLIASPLVYYFSNNWLNNFAFRINLSWMVFFLAGIAVTAIVFLTVGFQSLKAALTNPVDTLRSE